MRYDPIHQMTSNYIISMSVLLMIKYFKNELSTDYLKQKEKKIDNT